MRVLHPGFLSVEGGPDFRGASVQFGDSPPQSGDVEVDLRSSGWRAHGHDRNPAFKGVILHVVWECERPAAGAPPALALRQVLDAPSGELSLWLGGEAAQGLPEEFRGQCCAPLRELDAGATGRAAPPGRPGAPAEQGGPVPGPRPPGGLGAVLVGRAFPRLGYKHNVWPMQRLAELRPRWAARSAGPLALQARLFGISGLLPVELTRSESGADSYLRRIWDQWWRERDEFSDCILPRTLWRLHGQRPANHPQRRLALASRWSAAGDLPGRLERWCAADGPTAPWRIPAARRCRPGRTSSGRGTAPSGRPGSSGRSRSWV